MKIGFALGGGGAKGFAHIGAIEVLEEAGIHAEVVAGTSIGALVGSVYCAGTLPKLSAWTENLKLTDIPLLLSPTVSPKGFFSGKQTLELFDEYVDCRSIEELPKRFAAVAADLKSSTIVVFTEGEIKQAVRASFAIPVLFTPVVSAEHVLVDGGILEPVPVETARALGADLVIAIDLFGHFPTTEEVARATDEEEEKTVWPSGLTSAMSYLASISHRLPFGAFVSPNPSQTRYPRHVVDILESTLAISQRHLTELRLLQHPADIVIQPAVSHLGLLDFHRSQVAREAGRAAAREALPALRALLDSVGG